MHDLKFTVSGIAREARVPEATVRNWADAGLLPCQRDSAGRRLFEAEAIMQATVLREARPERRGR